MTVTARDQGIPAKTATTGIQVTVLRNSHAPVFTEDQYVVTVLENTTYDTVILDLQAIDNDSLTQPNVSIMSDHSA